MFLRILLLLLLPSLAAVAQNTLSDEEKAAGWQLLFDGKTTKGWHAAGGADGETPGWTAEDGELRLRRQKDGKTLRKDILTVQEYTDFDLAWDWKIEPAGNSGVKYNLVDQKTGLGCEYQLLDDAKHPDGQMREGRRLTGALYDLIAPAPGKKLNAPGAWNSSRVVVKGSHVEHWLNGAITAAFDFGSPDLKTMIAESKFKDVPNWGTKVSSPILLQDHENEVTFRNVKVRTPAER